MATRPAPILNDPAFADLDGYGLPGEPSWMEIDWRDHLHSAQIDGTDVNYVDLGEGPPVVFIHGLSGCWQNWLENLPYFAQRHRVIAVDLPGFGASALPAKTISIRGYGHCVDQLLQLLQLDQVCLVGNSMGGFVAAEVAISFRSRVARMVLTSPAGVHKLPGKASPSQAIRAASMIRPMTDAALKRANFLVRRPRGRRMLLGMVCRYPERLHPAMCMEMLAGANKPGFAAALRDTLSYDFRNRLGDVEAPTLIVWGRNDMIIPVRCADIYERVLPNSRKLILEQTGHVAMIERAPTFNRLVDDFLRAA